MTASIIAPISGALLGLIVFFAIAPIFFKEALGADPNRPKKFAIFLEALPSRGYLIRQGGRVAYTILGRPDFKPHYDGWASALVWPYRWYVWKVAGLHFIVPIVFLVHTYALRHRYRTEDKAGQKIYTPVEDKMLGFNSNHVRIDPEIWYFQYGGIEIETIPFAVFGGATYKIDEEGDGIEKALFAVDWAGMLDQALNSVIRRVARQEVTLDMVLGKIAKDIWEPEAQSEDLYGNIQKTIYKEVSKYQIEPSQRTVKDKDGNVVKPYVPAKKLKDFAILTSRVDIYDFKPELEPAELKRLQSAALKRQEARGQSLAGQGRAEEKDKVLAAIENHGDLATAILQSDAIIDAAAAGNINALLATWIAEKMPKG